MTFRIFYSVYIQVSLKCELQTAGLHVCFMPDKIQVIGKNCIVPSLHAAETAETSGLGNVQITTSFTVIRLTADTLLSIVTTLNYTLANKQFAV